MDILAIILGLLALGAAVAVDIWDIKTSLYYPLYTTGEKTTWFRSPDGYFSLKKGIIISVIIFICLLIPSFFFGPWALLVFAIPALGQGIVVMKNAKKQRAAKKGQFDILRNGSFASLHLIPFKGQYVLKPFYDVRGNNLVEVQDKLAELYLKLEADWWKLDRAQSL